MAANEAMAALLFAPLGCPSFDDVIALARDGEAFTTTEQSPEAGAELLCGGLTFALDGLAPGAARRLEGAWQTIALPGDFDVTRSDALVLSPGVALGRAARLLPVVRVLSALLVELTRLPEARAVAWIPARLVCSTAWFVEAVGIWLDGGPFPALALTALERSESAFTSRGLDWFVGQEFRFTGREERLHDRDVRGAVRLIDWLVAHGRVDSPCRIELAGFGAVRLEPDGKGLLQARAD